MGKNLTSDKYAINWLQQVSRKAAGEIRWLEGNGSSQLHPGVNASLLHEASLRQCKHCQAVWTYKPGIGRLTGYCRKCDGYVCDKAGCQDCYPAEQFIDDIDLAAGTFGPTRKQIEALVRRQAWREKVFSKR